jgi:hypothetical protein
MHIWFANSRSDQCTAHSRSDARDSWEGRIRKSRGTGECKIDDWERVNPKDFKLNAGRHGMRILHPRTRRQQEWYRRWKLSMRCCPQRCARAYSRTSGEMSIAVTNNSEYFY